MSNGKTDLEKLEWLCDKTQAESLKEVKAEFEILKEYSNLEERDRFIMYCKEYRGDTIEFIEAALEDFKKFDTIMLK